MLHVTSPDRYLALRTGPFCIPVIMIVGTRVLGHKVLNNFYPEDAVIFLVVLGLGCDDYLYCCQSHFTKDLDALLCASR